jgi:hypothetical protein
VVFCAAAEEELRRTERTIFEDRPEYEIPP